MVNNGGRVLIRFIRPDQQLGQLYELMQATKYQGHDGSGESD